VFKDGRGRPDETKGSKSPDKERAAWGFRAVGGGGARRGRHTKKKKIQCLFNKTQSDSHDLVRRALKLQYLLLIIVMKIWRSFKNYLSFDGRSSAALGAVNIRMGDRRGDFVASEEKTAAIPRHPFRYALPIFPGEPNKCGSRFIATYPLSFFFLCDAARSRRLRPSRVFHPARLINYYLYYAAK
jgi:hypothetical protein